MKILLISSSIHKNPNSEIALKEAEKAIKERGLEIEWLKLRDGFNVEAIKEADGFIWATPVYFGAWNGLSQDFYNLIKKENLFGKVFGMIAVGAKRNGGQETTITFAGWDLMKTGACMVNDGYPVSQFGGTCVAGIEGTIDDEKGLEMCYNLGRRVAETAQIIQAGNDILYEKVKSFLWAPKGNFRCRACPQCPSKDKFDRGEDYKCIYDDDDMIKWHKKIMEADIIYPIRYNLTFHERTRYLRRDNYRLTYHIAKITEPKWIPLFIKQNCILARKNIKKYAKIIKQGRKLIEFEAQIYEPIGHEKNPYLNSRKSS
jgi:multimeric flavodoxin WrbA